MISRERFIQSLNRYSLESVVNIVNFLTDSECRKYINNFILKTTDEQFKQLFHKALSIELFCPNSDTICIESCINCWEKETLKEKNNNG